MKKEEQPVFVVRGRKSWLIVVICLVTFVALEVVALEVVALILLSSGVENVAVPSIVCAFGGAMVCYGGISYLNESGYAFIKLKKEVLEVRFTKKNSKVVSLKAIDKVTSIDSEVCVHLKNGESFRTPLILSPEEVEQLVSVVRERKREIEVGSTSSAL